MPSRAYFPTLIYTASLRGRGWAEFNRQLLAECLQMRLDDSAGRRWSDKNYPGGYTSYNSAHRMHEISPTFAELQRKLNRHVRSFMSSLAMNPGERKLSMTDSWVNIMPRHVVHSGHLHPLSTISGTYYVQTPRGCPGLKFEDPRLDRFMASPPRNAWQTLPAQAGGLILFESWLRHEVTPNPRSSERISVSFNYGWF